MVIDNEPWLGDSGGLGNLNFQFCTNLSNSFLLFTKLRKKELNNHEHLKKMKKPFINRKGFLNKKGENFQFLP